MQREYSHGLLGLTDDLIGLVENVGDYVRPQAAQDDLTFMRSDAELRTILTLLGDFGKAGRYQRLDEFLDPDSVDEIDPYRRWEELEFDVVQRQPGWFDRIQASLDTDELHRDAAIHIAGLIDRFARAVARMWTLGALPEDARRYSSLLGPFLGLRDGQLGERPG
jgi:hypothetical protein